MRARSLATGALLVALLTGACIPHVGHAPRVEPGPRFFLTGAVSHVPALQDEQMSIAPSLYLGANRGWVRHNGVAALIGVQAPLLALPFVILYGEDLEQFLSLFLFDTYVQPRRAEDHHIDYGFGTMVSRGMAVPYVQLGRTGDGGVYTTQAVAFTYGSFNRVIYWLPSLSARSLRADASRGVDYYVHGTIGWQQSELAATRREWAIGIGVVAEFRRRR